jgi:signal transduction histidine kinase
VRHGGPGQARVVVRYGERDLELAIHNGMESAVGRRSGDSDRQSRSGRGVLGMRERAALFGGELRAGPAPGGGFAVEARLPIGTAEP